METGTKVAIAAGAVVVTAVGIFGVVEHYKHASPAPTPPPAPAPVGTLQPGGTYVLTLTCPTSITSLFPPPPIPPSAAAAMLLSGFPVTPKAFNFSPDGKSAILTFTYNGTSPVTLPPIQLSGATACSTTLEPFVASFNNTFFQSVTLNNGQSAYTAQAKAGVLKIVLPTSLSKMVSITPSNTADTVSGSEVTLTGQPGTIAVVWTQPDIAVSPPIIETHTATITVS